MHNCFSSYLINESTKYTPIINTHNRNQNQRSIYPRNSSVTNFFSFTICKNNTQSNNCRQCQSHSQNTQMIFVAFCFISSENVLSFTLCVVDFIIIIVVCSLFFSFSIQLTQKRKCSNPIQCFVIVNRTVSERSFVRSSLCKQLIIDKLKSAPSVPHDFIYYLKQYFIHLNRSFECIQLLYFVFICVLSVRVSQSALRPTDKTKNREYRK